MRVALLCCVGVCCQLVLSPPVGAQGAPTAVQRVTEAEALEHLRASDLRVRAVRARIDEVRASQAARAIRSNPTFSFSRERVGQAHDEFFLGRQEVDVSGRLGRLREAGRLALGAAEAQGHYQLLEMQAEVRRAFAQLLLAQEREAIIEDGIRELEQIVRILRTREAEGEGSQYDRMRGQRALIDLEADRGAAAAAKAEARGRLAALIVPAADADLVASGTLDLPQAPAAVTLLLESAASRSDYRALQISAEQFGAEQRAANRLAVPTPTFTGGLKRSTLEGRGSSGYLFTADLTLPLFNRGQPLASLAVAQRTAAEAEAAALRRRIEADVRAAHAALVIHRDRAERYRAATVEAVEPLVKVARVGYEEGELGILELLDALRQSLDGRLRLLELITAARQATIELDRVVGTEIKP